MTVMHSKTGPLKGKAPLLLTAYGAYGETLDVDFRLERHSLLQRGWTIALAHVRGGGELGRRCAFRARLLVPSLSSICGCYGGTHTLAHAQPM